MIALLTATTAYAEITWDVSLSYNSDAEAFGFGAGINSDLANKKYQNVKLRADVNYYQWEEDVYYISVSASRLPVFLGARYFVPKATLKNDRLTVFGEGGAEISFDSAEAAVCTPTYCVKAEESETNFGIALGGGLRYAFTKRFFGGADLRYHAISGPYLSMGLLLGIYAR